MVAGRRERRQAKLAARIQFRLNPEGCSEPEDTPEVDFFFADDSRQRTPSRPGLGPLVAIGGVSVAAEDVRDLETGISDVCQSFKFPASEPFKWSPGRELWMHRNLHDDARLSFFLMVLNLLAEKEAVVTVVIEDTDCSCATDTKDAELDVARLYIERADNQCRRDRSHGFIVVDRPQGGRKDEDRFLTECAAVLESGTDYVKPQHIAHNVFSSSSHLSRLLQSADLITGCVLSLVAGEDTYSPPVFEAIRPLFNKESDRIGGYGLKLHPDLRLGNLYHWLCGDSHFWKKNWGTPMPVAELPYSKDPFRK